MIRSMTAFARRERRGDWGVLTWEIRSLNHRYLEAFVRLPEELRGLEPAVRRRLGERLQRGKVECNLRFQRTPGVTSRLDLNRDLAAQLLRLMRDLQGLDETLDSPRVTELLAWPGVVAEGELDLEPVSATAQGLLEETLDELLETREREGQELRAVIEQRLDRIHALAQDVRGYLPEIRQSLRQRLESRLSELEAAPDPGRLEQELVLGLQKMDVDEELDRLQAHVTEVRAALDRDEPVGRRLDFLMQELNREANTLGSKSAAAETSQASVELKVLIEQMREQVQNIE